MTCTALEKPFECDVGLTSTPERSEKVNWDFVDGLVFGVNVADTYKTSSAFIIVVGHQKCCWERASVSAPPGWLASLEFVTPFQATWVLRQWDMILPGSVSDRLGYCLTWVSMFNMAEPMRHCGGK